MDRLFEALAETPRVEYVWVLVMADELMKEIVNPLRLDALRRVRLFDTPGEEVFDRLSTLTATVLKTPICLLSLIDRHRVFIKSSSGLPEPWASAREAPLSCSFCKQVVGTTDPLIVEDSRLHPVFADHPVTEQFQVIAYLGIPLLLSDGLVLGSFQVPDWDCRERSGSSNATVERLTPRGPRARAPASVLPWNLYPPLGTRKPPFDLKNAVEPLIFTDRH